MESTYSNVFRQLMDVIADRKKNPTERSYTATLFRDGIPAIGKKIIEEAEEVIEAGTEQEETRQAHVVHEASDLIYHLFVLLGYCDITLDRIEAELARRFDISGLDEKAARGGNKAK